MAGNSASTLSNGAAARAEVSAERVRAFVLPSAAAVVLFAAIVYLQFNLFTVFPGPGKFSDMLGKFGFFAQFPLGVGFYFCYAWHTSLVQRANVHAEKLKKG
jgi:hypothetical protein